MSGRVALVCAVVLAGCAGPEQGELPLVERDSVAFAGDVQPIIGPGCASLDCHGAPDRPLRLYAEFGWRADRSLRDAPLAGEEIADNVAALATMPADRILGKPLATGAGGMTHVGGDLWPGTGDPSYECLRAWLDGDQSASCEAAIDLAPY